jgi:hypothetical protein
MQVVAFRSLLKHMTIRLYVRTFQFRKYVRPCTSNPCDPANPWQHLPVLQGCPEPTQSNLQHRIALTHVPLCRYCKTLHVQLFTAVSTAHRLHDDASVNLHTLRGQRLLPQNEAKAWLGTRMICSSASHPSVFCFSASILSMISSSTSLSYT